MVGLEVAVLDTSTGRQIARVEPLSAACEMAVEAVDVRPLFDPVAGWHRARIDSGSGDHHEMQVSDCRMSDRGQIGDAPQQVGADARASGPVGGETGVLLVDGDQPHLSLLLRSMPRQPRSRPPRTPATTAFARG